MTEFTKRKFLRAGWPNKQITATLPGLSATKNSGQTVSSNVNLIDLPHGQPYVLFLGNPLPVRGTEVLLAAAQKVFARSESAIIVCLLRPDPGSEIKTARERLLHRVKELGIEKQLICITKKAEPEEIFQSIKNSRAVVMPFLIIPSEIPLGVLESMQLGTPVITTKSGGTSEFVGDGGWIIAPGDKDALSTAILSALNDDEMQRSKAAICSKKMTDHPTWEDVGDSWLKLGLKVLEKFEN
ncbi:MAG: glycosyltransferase [Candidatus Berkelbacteria bacterium]|nr:glycosyltransferase [Candidatus Berkelbacteria bacterium]